MPKQKLKVQPLKRAYQPKYPSHSDPNPLLFPETRPYPFSQKMIDALGQAGFAGALLLSPLAASGQSDNGATKTNPFTIERTNLPYVPIYYGTGQPSRLSREDVIDFIHEVFVSEGLSPNRDTVFTAEGVSIPASSYDESCKIGFIWLDYYNFGAGMRKQSLYDWQVSSFKEEQLRERFVEIRKREYQQYARNPERFLNSLVDTRYRNRPIDHNYKQDLEEKLPQLNEQAASEQYFVQRTAAYEFAITLVRYQDEPSVERYYELLLRIDQEVEDPIERWICAKKTAKIASHLGRSVESLATALDEELQSILSTGSFDTFSERINRLTELLHLDHGNRYFGKHNEVNALLVEILNTQKYEDREAKCEDLALLLDEREVSLAEAHQLEQAANDGAYFIAPISYFDNRSIYQNSYNYNVPDSLSQELTALQAQMKAATTDEERNEFRAEIWECRNKINSLRREEATMKALRHLEAEVRQYIQWAKAQQGY